MHPFLFFDLVLKLLDLHFIEVHIVVSWPGVFLFFLRVVTLRDCGMDGLLGSNGHWRSLTRSIILAVEEAAFAQLFDHLGGRFMVLDLEICLFIISCFEFVAFLSELSLLLR